MAKPVLVVVADDEASRQGLARELEARYGAHYRIMSSASPHEALAGLARLRDEGADVPLVMADQWMPGRTGTQLLGRVRELYPTARRMLLIPWGDQRDLSAVVEARTSLTCYHALSLMSDAELHKRGLTRGTIARFALLGRVQ